LKMHRFYSMRMAVCVNLLPAVKLTWDSYTVLLMFVNTSDDGHMGQHMLCKCIKMQLIGIHHQSCMEMDDNKNILQVRIHSAAGCWNMLDWVYWEFILPVCPRPPLYLWNKDTICEFMNSCNKLRLAWSWSVVIFKSYNEKF
jgi:hypothetical protein